MLGQSTVHIQISIDYYFKHNQYFIHPLVSSTPRWK